MQRQSASMGVLYRRPTSRWALATWLDAVYARTRGDRHSMRQQALRAREIEASAHRPLPTAL